MSEAHRENMVVCYAGLIQDVETVKFLVYKFELVPHKAYDIHSGAFLQVKKSYYKKKVLYAYQNNSHLIIWHSHPFASHACFSAIDNENDIEQGSYLDKKLPELYFIAMLSGQRSTSARVFCKEKIFKEIDRLTILGQQGYTQIIEPNNRKR